MFFDCLFAHICVCVCVFDVSRALLTHPNAIFYNMHTTYANNQYDR